jgi:lipopolysaccharide biosynthesis glycosyltransferase
MPPGRKYINAGVLLINLRIWRAGKIREKLVDYIIASGGKLTFHDQDAINANLFDQIKLLDYKWNFNVWMFRSYWGRPRSARYSRTIRRETSEVVILHYLTKDKPWMFDAIVPKKHLYYHFLRQTEWADFQSFEGSPIQLANFFFNKTLDWLGFNFRQVREIAGSLIRWTSHRLS